MLPDSFSGNSDTYQDFCDNQLIFDGFFAFYAISFVAKTVHLGYIMYEINVSNSNIKQGQRL